MNGCIPWTGAKIRGYGVRTIKGKARLVHRLAYEMVKGPIPSGLCVLHICDNPACYNPDHLFLGTRADNVRDCARKGRWGKARATGARHGMAKLTLDQVDEIRRRYRRGLGAALAREFGTTRSNIHWIVSGGHWKTA